MRQCKQCGYTEPVDMSGERMHYLVCEDAVLCDVCYWPHYEQCDECQRHHEHDQAVLAADQLGKDYPDPVWTPNDEAAACLGDRRRRWHNRFGVEVGW